MNKATLIPLTLWQTKWNAVFVQSIPQYGSSHHARGSEGRVNPSKWCYVAVILVAEWACRWKADPLTAFPPGCLLYYRPIGCGMGFKHGLSPHPFLHSRVELWCCLPSRLLPDSGASAGSCLQTCPVLPGSDDSYKITIIHISWQVAYPVKLLGKYDRTV